MIARTHFGAVLVLAFSIQATAQNSPLEVATRVADRLVVETTFGFVEGLPHGEQEGFYHINFVDAVGEHDGAYSARAELHVDSTVSDDDLAQLALGLSFTTGDIEVLIGGRSIYSGSGDRRTLEHLDYALVRPAIRVPMNVDRGAHEVLIRFDPTGTESRIWIGLVRLDNELVFEDAEFVLPDGMDAGESSRFLVRPSGGGWVVPPVHLVSELPHRLAYSDWRYFTGTFLDALYTVSDTFDELDYTRYVNTHMDFFLQQNPIINRERRLRGRIESPFGHYFRFSLLDDMGMQTVPFAERLRRDPSGTRARADRELVDASVDHIMNDAERLADGTWARLNPDSLTVWADDLFMGSILLARMADIDNQPAYMDEAVKQAIQIHGYLNDEESGLYWHGYFDATGEKSSSRWGRANGWTMMAKTELLLTLPDDHPRRQELLDIFQSHAAGLLAVQSDDGRWHQVLDNTDTYLETSCTAMFTRAFAEGIRNGWLPEEGYREAAERGWAAVARQVRPDGMVEGIVRGTPIFYSDDEYQNHPTRLNDPRGLGAVLYAAAAMRELANTQ